LDAEKVDRAPIKSSPMSADQFDRVCVLRCFPQIPAYQCTECLRWRSDAQRVCYYCGATTISPKWRIGFHLTEVTSRQRSFWSDPESEEITAMDSLLDPVMAMTVEDYLFLRRHRPDLDDYVRRLFVQSLFDIVRIEIKIAAMSLVPGCQLTFLSWLGMQPGFDADELSDVLMWRDGGEECGFDGDTFPADVAEPSKQAALDMSISSMI
jgi:hypothetical protein